MTAWTQFGEGTALLFGFAYLYARALRSLDSWLARRRTR